MGDGVIVVDDAGEYLVFNDEAKRLVGLPTDPGIDLGAWRRSLAIYDADGRRLSPEEYPARRVLRGEPCEQVVLVVRDPQGERLGDRLAETQVVDGFGARELVKTLQRDLVNADHRRRALAN